MRKITLLFIMLFSITAFSQSKSDIKNRSGHSKMQKKLIGQKNTETDKKAFVGYKIYALMKVAEIELSKERLNDFISLMSGQYDRLQPVWQKYEESGSDGAKVDLMRVIVQNEEEVREFLTPEEKLIYLRYGDKAVTKIEFEDNFMSDSVLDKYKKSVE
ncbi:hypothetical protein V1389_02125 [Flavobacterium rakeshii]|uniref:hypothetical protein n=1 Tax=Flavobacterium rakeshii TaxID=1038845 RepID=UPI002E7BD116|nr:hypothetical protein [Flavobacterium rakeshii]MEE1897114.1 hypothetical protein [Flavobacterium rakeshii]